MKKPKQIFCVRGLMENTKNDTIPYTSLVYHPCDQREQEQCTLRQPEHE